MKCSLCLDSERLGTVLRVIRTGNSAGVRGTSGAGRCPMRVRGYRLLSLVACIALSSCGVRTNLLNGDRGQAAGPEGGLDARDEPKNAQDVVEPDVIQDVVSPDEAVTSCPQVAPSLVAGCTVAGQVCVCSLGKTGRCDDVGTDDRVAWRCESSGWIEIARCVERAACPVKRPTSGDPSSEASPRARLFLLVERHMQARLASCDAAASVGCTRTSVQIGTCTTGLRSCRHCQAPTCPR